MEIMTVRFTNPAVYDKLYMLSAEYSVSAEFLVSLAVKRLDDEIELVRELRTGKAELRKAPANSHSQNE